MDGLTISNSQKMLESGKTTSQMRADQMRKDGQDASDAGGKSFADTLKSAVNDVNDLQKVSDFKMQQLATGENTNIPEVMIAADKADIALRLMVQVRNKIIEAYQEVMKMQV